ncbi:hypothetical protein HDZ31DRAFT_85468 [Schizophyllum fasciatum]
MNTMRKILDPCDEVRNALRCPVSGATENLCMCRPIPYDAADMDETEVARMEWVFGLPRGGLWYYLRSQENAIHLRKDICEMYSRGDFILAPTFQGYLEVMEFMHHSGIKDREDDDDSPRRPLSALARPDGLFRYVFIPCTDAARTLLHQFRLQRQSEADLNGGLTPYDNEPCLPESWDLPIVECYAHPYSTPLSGQWHAAVWNIVAEWDLDNRTPVPQWFVDEPSYDRDDGALSATEANGYDALTSVSEGIHEVAPTAALVDPGIDDDDHRKKVCHWFTKIDPKAKPPRERSPPPRRSRRIQEMIGMCPPPSPADGEPSLSPVRRGPLRARNPARHPPAWTRRNGRFPTYRFTSNDWAFFRYRVVLAGSAADWRPGMRLSSRAT